MEFKKNIENIVFPKKNFSNLCTILLNIFFKNLCVTWKQQPVSFPYFVWSVECVSVPNVLIVQSEEVENHQQQQQQQQNVIPYFFPVILKRMKFSGEAWSCPSFGKFPNYSLNATSESKKQNKQITV